MHPTQTDRSPALTRLFQVFIGLTLTLGVFYLLVVGRDFLIPLVLAVFLWYLVKILTDFFDNMEFGPVNVPRWLAFGFSTMTIFVISVFLVQMVSVNVARVADAAPLYQKNLEQFVHDVLSRFPENRTPRLESLLDGVRLGTAVSSMASTLAIFIGNAGLVAAYMFFLFLEQRYFGAKLRALLPDDQRRQEIERIIERIDSDTRTYIGIKTFVSLVTALFSYAVLKIIGLDFSEFWALVIFLFNFIPNIGSLIATALPALLALLQFATWGPFLVIVLGVSTVQLVIGNFVEPSLMGRSLNVSPLVIMLSLVLWGILWGIPGMFLCVPITAVAMIILAHFPGTRWVAVLLSKDGEVMGIEGEE